MISNAAPMAENSTAAGLGSFDYHGLDADIANHMRSCANRILAVQRASIVEVGRELTAAKKLVEHGWFVQWIETACQMNIRTAERAMRVAEFVEKNDNLSYLPPDGPLALASRSTPKPVVDSLLDKIATGQRPSAAEIKCRIAEAKATERRACKQKPAGAKPQDLESDSSQREAGTADLIDMLLASDRIAEFVAASKKANLSKVVEALEKRYAGCGAVVEAELEAAPIMGCRPGAQSPRKIIHTVVSSTAPVTATGELSGDAPAAQAAELTSSRDGAEKRDGGIEQAETVSLQESPIRATGVAVESDVATEPEAILLPASPTPSDPTSADQISETAAEPLEIVTRRTKSVGMAGAPRPAGAWLCPKPQPARPINHSSSSGTAGPR